MLKLAKLQEQVSVAPHTTMKVGGPEDYFLVADSAADVKEACDWAAEQHIPVFVLGEGSNIVVSDAPLHKIVLKMELLGVEKVAEDKDSVTLSIGAGEHWDAIVERTVKLGLSGVEAMSFIPGTAGAAP